ncbi:MAG: hypothetical protein F4X02_04820 [Chloroflexi bacterium]|nr:hypothetical protein [Chloroflexota bacterium]
MDANLNRLSASRAKLFHFVGILLCLSFVYAWGATRLNSDPIAPAEYNSLLNIFDNQFSTQLSLGDTLLTVAAKDETHPPGYFLLLNIWSRLVGIDAPALRLLSVYFGLFALAFTYRLARLLGSPEQALAAATALAFTAYFVFYLHEVRMYSLLAMVAASTAWSYARIVHSPAGASASSLIVLCLSSAAAIYTHAFGFILLAAIGIYHLIFIPKNKTWMLVCVAMIGAGCLYLPWLPYLLQMLDIRTSYAAESLNWQQSVLALASIYNNGIAVLVPACAILLIIQRKRLSAPGRFMVLLVALVVLVALAVNEFAPMIVARRIRYSIILAPLWSCALALALSALPKWKLICVPALLLWTAAFAYYNESPAFDIYTNSFHQNRKQIPHYEALLYEPVLTIRQSDFVLSIHRDTELDWKTLDYYGRKSKKWRGLIHVWYDENGNPAVQGTDTRYDSVDSMERWDFPIWLIYNPQETDLQAMPAFSDAFLARFHSCGRYLETANTIIELYVKRAIPCQLLTAEAPLSLSYDNGTELANISARHDAGSLDISLWWTNTIASKYAISIQAFDAENAKAAQLDDVVGGAPLHGYSLDLSGLAPGDYIVKLILYDFETGQGQPGMITATGQPFERSVDVGRITISE